jgi:hypothetical protein
MDVFRRENDDGSYMFTDEEVRHFLPWVLLNLDVDLSTLDDGMVALFAEACSAAGVKDGMDVDDIMATFAAYYAAQPPRAELAAAFETVWKQVNAEAPPEAKNPFARFSGAAPLTAPVAGAARPAGTIPAGPMARFQPVPPKQK